MGCSSSALGKAGDSSSRLRSEESESGFVQPKPLSRGREATIYDKEQKESLPPLEKLKISAMSAANGVKSLHEQALAKDAIDQPGSVEKTQPLEGLRESGPLQPGGKHDTLETGEKKDVEMLTGAQSSEGNAETEPLMGEAQGQPLKTAGERYSPGAVGDTEIPLTAREMKPLRIAEKMPLPEAGREPQPQEAMGKPPLLETVPRETEVPGILEGSQLVETTKEHEVQETLGRDEQSQLLKTMPREKGFPEIPEGSQLVKTAVKNDLIHKAPEGPENMEQIQPEGVVGSMEHPAGVPETGTDVEMVRKINTNKEDHHIEGETGEKVETEKEEVSKGAETQEEETGEAVDLSAAT
ncbi:glutamate rich 5 [Phyllostomus discolor]|uniref:Glutamate rich 5 n=1 Tax=Phyllostomus discolor TaxID=89673 RepID=A0A7E6E6G9_9CHIR|nr:glutamate-rich protein 5 [Phyllostomus discolor]KAF6099244.1 glutamate rich 5 [Phyllostomus discolor]